MTENRDGLPRHVIVHAADGTPAGVVTLDLAGLRDCLQGLQLLADAVGGFARLEGAARYVTACRGAGLEPGVDRVSWDLVSASYGASRSTFFRDQDAYCSAACVHLAATGAL